MSINFCSNEPLLSVKKNNDGLLILHLNDLNSRNAMSLSMAEQIDCAIKENSFKGLLLTHEGDFFCSGGHLKNYQEISSKQEGLNLNQKIAEILNRLHKLSVPKACAVSGLCVGGGVELLSCFDYVVASPDSLFGLWQRRMGLSFGWGGEERLVEKLTKNKLNNWLLSAETLSVYSALEMGLVNKVSMSCHTQSDCLSWLHNVIDLGFESVAEILNKQQEPTTTFSKLWLGEKHMKALKKFK